MSRNARFIGFGAHGGGLPVPGTSDQIYVRDRLDGTTTMVSVSSDEVPSNAGADSGVTLLTPCPISNDGRYVAFVSYASDLAPGDSNAGKTDIFRRDRQLGITERASVATGGGTKANSAANSPAMSGDGSTIAFESASSNLVAGDTNNLDDVFVHLFGSGGTFRMSVKPGGGQVYGYSGEPSLSADGLKVAFYSQATDLVANDTNGVADVFVRNRSTDTVVRGSVLGANVQLSGESSGASLSDDGTRLAFTQDQPDVVAGDANQDDDVYLRTLTSASTALVSVAKNGNTGDAGSAAAAVSGDGTVVAFRSYATNLVRNDTNGSGDVFARDSIQELTPFPSSAALIAQQYGDFVGRPPTATESAEWTARLDNGEQTPDELIDELAHGSAWAAKRAPLTRLYWAFFLRVPDLGGMDYWTKQLTNGKKLAVVAKQFAGSSEFQTKYGSKTNSQFVTLIYQNIFDRDPDAGGLAYWTEKLDTKAKTRGDVMVNFSESSEGKRVLAPQTDTVLVWLGGTLAMPSKTAILEAIDAYHGGYPPEILGFSLRKLPAYVNRVS